jgi:hypothetical protein
MKGVVSMTNFRNLAKEHWKKYLPGLTKELQKRGILERELDQAARQASEELARLVSGGHKWKPRRR